MDNDCNHNYEISKIVAEYKEVTKTESVEYAYVVCNKCGDVKKVKV